MIKVLDELNKKILQLLQRDARMTNLELAHQVQLSPPGLQKRLRKLQESGLIEGHVTLVNREMIGFDLLCLVHIDLTRHDVGVVRRFHEAINNMPEVLECYHTTGDHDYLLKVVAKNRKHLEDFMVNRLTPIPGVDRIYTSLVLSEVKRTTALPLEKL